MAKEYIEKYIDPIQTTRHTHSLMYSNKYKVKYRDPDVSDEPILAEVIDLDIVNEIMVTAQMEAVSHFIDTLMEDTNIVMLDELKESLTKYASKSRTILEGKL